MHDRREGMPGQAAISGGIRSGCSIGNGVTVYPDLYTASCRMPSVGADLPGMLSLRSCIPGYGVAGFLGGSQLLGTYVYIIGFLRMPFAWLICLPCMPSLRSCIHGNLGLLQEKSVKKFIKQHHSILTVELLTLYRVRTLFQYPQTTAMLYAVVHESDKLMCLSDFLYPQTPAQHYPLFMTCICLYLHRASDVG